VNGTRIAKILSGSCILVLLSGLIFRGAIYSKIYIAPGDPYGLADIIEYGIGLLLTGLLAISSIVAIILAIKGPPKNRIAAGWLVTVIVSVFLLAAPLHNLAARWSV
jgi:hypothetical protein